MRLAQRFAVPLIGATENGRKCGALQKRVNCTPSEVCRSCRASKAYTSAGAYTDEMETWG